LISLLTIPPPAEDVLTRVVWDLDLIHDTELVASADKETLSELVETSLKHGTEGAIAGGTSVLWVHGTLGGLTSAVTLRVRAVKMVGVSLALKEILATAFDTIVASAAWNWVRTPLSAVWRNVSLSRDLDVSVGAIIKVDRRILICVTKCVALETFLSDLRTLWT